MEVLHLIKRKYVYILYYVLLNIYQNLLKKKTIMKGA